jgi:hypothetical protein
MQLLHDKQQIFIFLRHPVLPAPFPFSQILSDFFYILKQKQSEQSASGSESQKRTTKPVNKCCEKKKQFDAVLRPHTNLQFLYN